MNRNHQSGSVSLIVAVVLAVLLIGAVGYLGYQKISENKSTNSSAKAEVDTQTSNQIDNSPKDSPRLKGNEKISKRFSDVYNGQYYSFEYPMADWVVEESENGGLTLKTADYSVGPLSVASGSAVVVVRGSEYYNSASSLVDSYKKKGMVTNVDNVNVGSLSGQRFNCYEFCLYNTAVDKDGILYQIQFHSKDESQISVYDQFLESFTVK